MKLAVHAALVPFVLAIGGCGSGTEPRSSHEATSSEPDEPAPRLVGGELSKMLADPDIFLLDVREPSELEELGTVEGYVNIPIGQLEERLDEIPKDRPILTA